MVLNYLNYTLKLKFQTLQKRESFYKLIQSFEKLQKYNKDFMVMNKLQFKVKNNVTNSDHHTSPAHFKFSEMF